MEHGAAGLSTLSAGLALAAPLTATEPAASETSGRMWEARPLLRGCRAQRSGRAARGTRPQLIQSRAYARSVHAHRAPTCVSRCAAARTGRSMRACGPLGLAALRGERQAGRAHATRPSPRPRPSAEPKAPGSAPLPSSWTAAPQTPGVASTLNLCGAFDSSPPTRNPVAAAPPLSLPPSPSPPPSPPPPPPSSPPPSPPPPPPSPPPRQRYGRNGALVWHSIYII